MRTGLKKLEVQIWQRKPELDGKIARLQAKTERNTEYRKRAYEQFMDDILSKEEYLELKQMYENENRQYQKELAVLRQEEQKQQETVNQAKTWMEHFNRRKLTEKQLTRDVLVELIDKIYVYPDQKIDIYFKFTMNDDSQNVILQKDGVM